MAILIDTNILLRLLQSHHPHGALVERAVATLRGRNETFSTIGKTPQMGPYVEAGFPDTRLTVGVGVYGTLTSEGGCHQ
jgi:hypothetical protein